VNPGPTPSRHHAIEVDWVSDSSLTAEERARIVDWYGKDHGEGNLDCARFVSFWLEQDQRVFKRYRRWVDSTVFGALPALPGALLYLHYYTIAGWEEGALYEVIGAYHRGASKSQVVETLAQAFIHAGPMGISRVGRECGRYLDKWNEAAPASGSWPDGWEADPAALSSGLDFSSKGLSPSESERLLAWYEENQGEVPLHVRHLARYNPEGLKASRARYELSAATLPKQIVPLFSVLTSAITGNTDALRRATFQARKFGVTRQQLLATIERSMAYTGEMGTSRSLETVAPLLDRWPDDDRQVESGREA
jgi:hypothetical protein